MRRANNVTAADAPPLRFDDIARGSPSVGIDDDIRYVRRRVVVRLPGPRTRYWVRRALALTHSAVEWVLTLPATVLLRHQLPHLSATVDPIIDDTDVSWAAAAWARHTLVGRLATDPTLDGWTVLVFALLHRPPDRWAPPADHHRVGYHDTGAVLRRHLERELPGALTRRAAAYLATIVDDNCPPA